MKPNRFLAIFLFFFTALTSLTLKAQQPAGATVHGTVTDPDEAVIPGATITLTPPKGKAVTVQSGSDGAFTAKGVAPGNYVVTATMSGFATFVREGVRVAPGQQPIGQHRNAHGVRQEDSDLDAEDAKAIWVVGRDHHPD